MFLRAENEFSHIAVEAPNVTESLRACNRAGLNEREPPGKVMTARPPKRLAQLSSVSHTLVATLQKLQSKTSKLMGFGSLHFRDNWGDHVRQCVCG